MARRSIRSRAALGSTVLVAGLAGLVGTVAAAPGTADLVVRSSVAESGGDLTYGVAVVNRGPDLAEGTVLTISLPAGALVLSATGCVGTAPDLRCALGDVASGEQVDLSYVVHPTRAGTATARFRAQSPASDPNPGDNLATSTIGLGAVGIADLRVGSSTPQQGPNGDLSYTLTVTNGGDDDAAPSVLASRLPASFRFVSAPGCTFVSPNVQCAIGQLGNGASVSFPVVVHPVQTGSFQLANRVDGTTPDPAPANNQLTVPVSLSAVGVADLATSVVSTVRTGSTVRFTYRVTNLGDDDGNGIVLSAQLPNGVTFAGSPDCVVEGRTVLCGIGDLGNAGVAEVTFDATKAASFSVNATVASTTADPTSSNNSARATG